MHYELYYWPSNQGRGEFVRLALEEVGADYIDVGRVPEAEGGGVPAILKLINASDLKTPPFAPPFLKAGDLIIGHTANILLYLGAHHGLAPAECIFIDDSLANVEGARAFGMQGHHFKTAAELRADLKRQGLPLR